MLRAAIFFYYFSINIGNLVISLILILEVDLFIFSVAISLFLFCCLLIASKCKWNSTLLSHRSPISYPRSPIHRGGLLRQKNETEKSSKLGFVTWSGDCRSYCRDAGTAWYCHGTAGQFSWIPSITGYEYEWITINGYTESSWHNFAFLFQLLLPLLIRNS